MKKYVALARVSSREQEREGFSLDVQEEALNRLSADDAMAVVTGQQPGCLGGPLYTFAKILSAVVFAEKLQEQWGVPVIPVLWDGGDDHDLAEIDHFAWPVAEEELKVCRLDLSRYACQPAWTVPLTQEMLSEQVAFIQSVHPPTEYRNQALSFIGEIWNTRWKVDRVIHQQRPAYDRPDEQP